MPPAIHTNNGRDRSDGCYRPEHSTGKEILTENCLCSPEQALQGAQGARLVLHTQDAAATPGIALGTATGTAQTPPSAPVRDKPAPKEALTSGKGEQRGKWPSPGLKMRFKLWQTLICAPAASPPQGP